MNLPQVFTLFSSVTGQSATFQVCQLLVLPPIKWFRSCGCCLFMTCLIIWLLMCPVPISVTSPHEELSNYNSEYNVIMITGAMKITLLLWWSMVYYNLFDVFVGCLDGSTDPILAELESWVTSGWILNSIQCIKEWADSEKISVWLYLTFVWMWFNTQN